MFGIKKKFYTFLLPIIIGNPWDGYIENAMNAKFYVIDKKINMISVSEPKFQYASHEMIDLLNDLSTYLVYNLPTKAIQIGVIALVNGGPILRHIHHQTGLQADLSYISHELKFRGHRGKKINNAFTENFVNNGQLSANFDLQANYELITYLVEKKVHVAVDKIIFKHIISYNRFMKKVKDRDLKTFIAPAPYHNDHFHISIHCYKLQSRCKRDWVKWTQFGRSHKHYPKEYVKR